MRPYSSSVINLDSLAKSNLASIINPIRPDANGAKDQVFIWRASHRMLALGYGYYRLEGIAGCHDPLEIDPAARAAPVAFWARAIG